jgi:hypothetical protein
MIPNVEQTLIGDSLHEDILTLLETKLWLFIEEIIIVEIMLGRWVFFFFV